MVINNIYKKDLDKVKWQMLFNLGKCKCLHARQGNLGVNYKVGNTILGTNVKEKDLGVTISVDMNVSKQLQRVIKVFG